MVFHQSVVAFPLVSVVRDFSLGEPMGTGTVTITRASSAKAVGLGAKATVYPTK